MTQENVHRNISLISTVTLHKDFPPLLTWKTKVQGEDLSFKINLFQVHSLVEITRCLPNLFTAACISWFLRV